MKTSDFLLKQIATELKLSTKQIESVIKLLEDGNTVPFIARYRKEQTGSLDEVQIQTISERYTYIQNVTNRKEEVIRLIAEQDKLTDELKKKKLNKLINCKRSKIYTGHSNKSAKQRRM
ncbi:hypothetical protein BsIDN1_09380 [Bacillus safensis]|uniref:Tex-like protein N-terminal domain-containing protein n=1 Tax=Bacillus safensis TaxID=561879 RepID=A0A5S9M147_BACIA|nr:hypothetical protein BsIDN1_09380 [Bacillus safensis]